MKRILLSARDPGGAGHIIAIARHLRNSTEFEISLVASEPAYKILCKAGEAPIFFELIFNNDCDVNKKPDHSRLLKAARQIIREISPDAILVSLSSLGVGIDEALLAVADVPKFAVQDFWGDVNLDLGTPADLYFVLDDYAAEFSKSRWGVNAEAVGAPKYTLYKDFDINRRRDSFRRYLGVDNSEAVLGWFGQSPDIPGHEDVFADVLDALADLEIKPKFILREHPKFSKNRRAHIAAANRNGIKAIDVTGRDSVEESLLACDLVITPFSLCGLDHAYLSAYSSVPIGSVIYVMTNEPIRDFCNKLNGMISFPILDQGIGCLITDPEQLTDTINRQLNSKNILAYFKNSKILLKNNSLAKITERISARLN